MNTIQKIKRFTKLFLLWFFIEPKWIWFSLILTMAPLLFLYFFFSKENMIRAGVILQWIGIFSVFLNIRKTKNEFNKPNNIGSFKKWLNNKPRFNPKPTYIKPEGISVGMSLVGVSLIEMAIWDEEKNTEENIRRNINILNKCIKDIDELENKFRNEISQINTSLSNKIYEIKSSLNDLKSNIENVATGGLNLTFVSSAWILIGITMSTIPDDIICILNWLFNKS